MQADPIVEAVRDLLLLRSQIGMKKYEKTMERNDLDFFDWVDEAQQEMLDGAVYLQKLKQYRPLFDQIKRKQELMLQICRHCEYVEKLL